MQLHKATLFNRLAKKTASPLSRIICSALLRRPARVLDAYMNFLMGKGAGTGWDLEREVQVAVSLMTCDAPVLFDIGANVGDWSSKIIDALPRAQVYLFEPSLACQERIRSRRLPNSVLIPTAVGERAGKAQLHFSSSLDGTASLHTRGDSYFRDLEYQSIEVEVVTLDDVIRAHGIESVDFVKMDIEGHEFAALQGAIQALKAGRIRALSFEFGSGNINSRTFFRDFWNLLTSYNFKLWRVTPGARLLPIDDYYEDCEYFRGVSNYIAKLKPSSL